MRVGIPTVMLLAAIGGFWLASIGLRRSPRWHDGPRDPLFGMEDLGESTRSDEFGQLATAFNGLVARLRAALSTQRQFMADASHELRTPVSVIRSAADVILSREHRDEAEYREALAIVGGEARRVSRLVEDMLVLGRADAGGYPLQSGRICTSTSSSRLPSLGRPAGGRARGDDWIGRSRKFPSSATRICCAACC